MDWDDLRFFLAVARFGSVRAAAEKLQVNHSTVSRRINLFEEKQGARLFERLPSGFALTMLGQEIFDLAGEIEAKFAVLERRVSGRDSDLKGKVSLALSSAFVDRLAPVFVRFQQEYPAIQLALLVGLEAVNLTNREADVALRVTNTPPENMVGRKLADMRVALYASHDYVARMSMAKTFADHHWIGWEKGVVSSAYTNWLEENIPSEQIVCRINTAEAMYSLTRAGMGISHQLCYLADGDNCLTRVLPETLPIEIGLWLLSHPDLRATTRVKKLLHYLETELSAQKDLLEGKLK